MSSKIDICNRALCLMGHGVLINHLQEDSMAAHTFNLLYVPTLKEVLREHSWNFATAYQSIPCVISADDEQITIPGAMKNNVGLGWGYAHALPVDMIKIIEIVKRNDEDDIPFEVVSGMSSHIPYRSFSGKSGLLLLSNCQSPCVKYIRYIDNESLFDSLFEEAFILKLSIAASAVMTQDRGLQQELWGRYQQKMMQAKTVDSNEGFSMKQQVPHWISMRS